MAEEASWTLDELVGRIAAALATPAYPGAPNGRVRDLPDRRAVRWYATAGIVDRPAMRGRTAVYGARHLLQIVSVKRLQAQGLTLAEIQAELAGATDETLRRIADIPDELEPEQPPSARARPANRRDRFWADPPRTDEPALLLLPAQPREDDIHPIRAAARPLLELLADRGLLPLDERSST
jgi:DNA-binding transcriptional MerR regulator